MLSVEFTLKALQAASVDFFCGVPDSLLKQFCIHLQENMPSNRHVIAANEGNAIALATGHHLAGGGLSLVYLQNSGQGNVVNPILSLASKAVYSIPMILLVGWRGEPGQSDEPQHIKQGAVTEAIFRSMAIPTFHLPSDPHLAEQTISQAAELAILDSQPVAIMVSANTFSKVNSADSDFTIELPNYPSREAALEIVLDTLPADFSVFATTGKTSRELLELRKKRGEEESIADFLTVGSMGHVSSIALGAALALPKKRILCLDGDGASIMHLGSWTTIGQKRPKNFYHIVLNNGAHESVGGQPTAGFDVDFVKIAQGCGYVNSYTASTPAELRDKLPLFLGSAGPNFLEMKLRVGSRPKLGRPKLSPIEAKQKFMSLFKHGSPVNVT
ncbi:MAG: phosphonopyruvate decarboxylase [Planctomycetota bacterium]|jgi:phosphonopyruvate decarboxylase